MCLICDSSLHVENDFQSSLFAVVWNISTTTHPRLAVHLFLYVFCPIKLNIVIGNTIATAVVLESNANMHSVNLRACDFSKGKSIYRQY